MRMLFALVTLAAAGTAAEPPAFKLSDADGKRWAERVRVTVARDGWTVEVSGNDVTVRRTMAVAVSQTFPNSPDGKPTPGGDLAVRYVLRFGERVTADEYDKRAGVNAASAKEHDRLKGQVGVAHKFDDFVPTTDAEKERVRAYREAVSKLPRHDLPHLYTPDHAVYLLHSWDGWSFPTDEAERAECREVETALLKLFGVYDPKAVADGGRVGNYLPEPRR